MVSLKNNTIISILRSIKDITNVFNINDSLKLRFNLSYGIYVKDMSYFNSSIEDYHILFGHNRDTSLIHIVIKRTHFLIDKDKNIFIHISSGYDDWTHLHLITDEIYDDDVELCLRHGRVLFEEI